MGLLAIILVLILIQYLFFGMKVGGARMKFGVKAPAISGHPEFERHYRVQQNTLEQLIIFIPLYIIFAIMAESQGWMGYEIASGLGVLWIIGRFVYSASYVKDPDSRGKGFMIGFLAIVILLVGTLAASIMSLIG